MILHLVIAPPPRVGDIFNYTTDSGMSNSMVKITTTSTQTAKHTQGIWEIIVRLFYLKLCAALARRLQECLGTEALASPDQLYPPCEKKEGKFYNCYNFFRIEKGSDVSMKKKKTSLLV